MLLDTSCLFMPRDTPLHVIFGKPVPSHSRRTNLPFLPPVPAADSGPLMCFQIKKMQAAALLEDANCFDYDSFYDGIQEKREKEKADSYLNEKSGPRYLTSMMAARDQRQRVRDMIFEKKEALAAKADEELFGEKEQFATAAYKKKIEEDRKFAEELAARSAAAVLRLLLHAKTTGRACRLLNSSFAYYVVTGSACRDKADEGRTVDAQGMDGFLGVIESAMAKRATQVEEAPETDAAVPEDGCQPEGSHGPASVSFEAVMAKKAKLRLEKKMAEMDRYERKRFELERGLVQPTRPRGDAAEADSNQPDANGAGGSAPGEAAAASESERVTAKGDAPHGQAVPRKRTAEDRIEAARARAKERRTRR